MAIYNVCNRLWRYCIKNQLICNFTKQPFQCQACPCQVTNWWEKCHWETAVSETQVMLCIHVKHKDLKEFQRGLRLTCITLPDITMSKTLLTEYGNNRQCLKYFGIYRYISQWGMAGISLLSSCIIEICKYPHPVACLHTTTWRWDSL